MRNVTLGKKVCMYRKRAEISQLNLEVEINASPGTISRIETGRVNPTKETLNKIARVLALNAYEEAGLFGIEFDEEKT